MAQELIEPMEFFKIDKISDDVYVLGPNVVLRFNVSLSKISNGKRYHYHKEYEYPSRLPECPTMVTIKRSFDYFLSLENMQKDSNGNKVFIRIGVQEFMLFRKAIEECVAWFTDKKYNKLFASDKGKMVLVAPIPEFNMPNLPMSKYLKFSPVIIDKGIANADKEPGVRIELGDSSQFIDINVDKLMGLYYIVSCFNMYEAATIMVNYIQRPDFGFNRFTIESQPRLLKEDDSEPMASGINDRYVNSKNSKNNISLLEG